MEKTNEYNMAAFRIIYTKYWDDPIIEQLSADSRYCYLFLLTNPLATECGIYQITLKKMAHYLGHTEDSIRASIETLTTRGRLVYDTSTCEVCLFKKPNYVPNSGKPVLDCIISELSKVKNTDLIIKQLEHITNDKIRDVYVTWTRGRQKEEKEKEEYSNSITDQNIQKNSNTPKGGLGGKQKKNNLSSSDDPKADDPKAEEPKSLKKAPVVSLELEIENPFTENFLPSWSEWKEYKKLEHRFHYKTPISEKAALKKLFNLSNGDESIAISIIRESIANGWEGFFPLKQTNEKTSTTNSANGTVQYGSNRQSGPSDFFTKGFDGSFKIGNGL